jgi:hypothetical protein
MEIIILVTSYSQDYDETFFNFIFFAKILSDGLWWACVGEAVSFS